MKRAVCAALAAVLLFTALTACGNRKRRQWVQNPEVVEISLAVGKGCPEGALNALQGFCDDVYALSSGTLRVNMQHWDNPLSANADLAFLLTDHLSALSKEFSVLRTDFLFQSYEQMNAALNAPSVRAILSAPLLKQYGYAIHSTFYCGRQYLISAENNFTATLRADNAEDIRGLVKDILNGIIPMTQANFAEKPAPKTVYYTDTAALAALTAQSAHDYVLVRAPYHYHTGLFCMEESLSKKRSKKQLAYLQEAAAYALPACGNLYLEMDARLSEIFTSVISPSQKLQRAIRAQQDEGKNSILTNPFVQKLDEYNT